MRSAVSRALGASEAAPVVMALALPRRQSRPSRSARRRVRASRARTSCSGVSSASISAARTASARRTTTASSSSSERSATPASDASFETRASRSFAVASADASGPRSTSGSSARRSTIRPRSHSTSPAASRTLSPSASAGSSSTSAPRSAACARASAFAANWLPAGDLPPWSLQFPQPTCSVPAPAGRLQGVPARVLAPQSRFMRSPRVHARDTDGPERLCAAVSNGLIMRFRLQTARTPRPRRPEIACTSPARRPARGHRAPGGRRRSSGSASAPPIARASAIARPRSAAAATSRATPIHGPPAIHKPCGWRSGSRGAGAPVGAIHFAAPATVPPCPSLRDWGTLGTGLPPCRGTLGARNGTVGTVTHGPRPSDRRGHGRDGRRSGAELVRRGVHRRIPR